MDKRHIVKTATNLAEATCLGRFVGVAIEKVLVNVPIVGEEYSDDKGSIVKFTLVRVVYSNLWNYRICTNIRTGSHDIRMIDSEGFQYSAGCNVYEGSQKAEVKVSKKESVKYDFIYPEARLEVGAKTRGWLWFPVVPKGVFPQRFIFHFQISKAGDDSVDVEILEIQFNFQPNQHLVGEIGFKTLELENG